MNLVIQNQLIIDALGSEEYGKVAELMHHMETYPNLSLIDIVDKIEELDLNYEAYEEVQLVGSRPTTIRH